VVHSQTLRASASEVHAMVEGAIRHGTTMKVEGNYVDTHGQSEIGFGITRCSASICSRGSSRSTRSASTARRLGSPTPTRSWR